MVRSEKAHDAPWRMGEVNFSEGFRGAVCLEQEIRPAPVPARLFRRLKINPEGWRPRY